MLPPTQQEEPTKQEERAGNKRIGGPVESAPKSNHIADCQPAESQKAGQFPTPRHGQQDQEDGARDQVHGQRKERGPEAMVFLEDIQREDADEAGEKEAEDARHPIEDFNIGGFHTGSIGGRPPATLIDISKAGIEKSNTEPNLA